MKKEVKEKIKREYKIVKNKLKKIRAHIRKKKKYEIPSPEEKAVNLTKYSFSAPNYRVGVAIALVIGFLFWFVNGLLKENFASALIFGSSDGILLGSIPALIAAALAASIIGRKEFKINFSRMLILSNVSLAIYGITTITANLLKSASNSIFIIGNTAIFILWFIVLLAVLNKFPKAFMLSLFQPALNLSFLVLSHGYASIEASSPLLLILRFAVSVAIALFSFALFFFIVNSPTKRNLGINGFEAFSLFLAQWLHRDKGLENVLSEMGENAIVPINVVEFRSKKNRTPKAFFVIPSVHFGPVGNIGGSEYPYLIAKKIKKATNAETFVFHTAATHNLNPIYASDYEKISEAALKITRRIRKFSERSSILEAHNAAKALGITAGDSIITILSRAPAATDDIENSAGVALEEQMKVKGWKNAFLVEAHNSFAENHHAVNANSPEFFEYANTVEEMKKMSSGNLKLGVATTQLNIGEAYGVGRAGLKVAVFEIGKERAALVLIDANNIAVKTYETLMSELKKKFDFVEVLTTDTHAVNSLSRVHNPIDKRAEKILKRKIIEAVRKAEGDTEECTAGFGSRLINIKVFGSNRQSEIISTVNSIVAVARIIAPLIFIGAVVLALISLAIIK